MSNIIWVGDFQLNAKGEPISGYSQISTYFCQELSKQHKVFALGFGYQRQQHNYNFSLTHCHFPNIKNAIRSIDNQLKIDYLINCFDLTHHENFLKDWQSNAKYLGVFAIESDPICMDWAITLSKMDYRFAISEFGKKEIEKLNLDAKHLITPIFNYKRKTQEEKIEVRKIKGWENRDILFMNADGNERKNISATLEAIKIIKQTNPKILLVLLTNKNSPVSWRLDNLILHLGITDNCIVYDKGLSQDDVRDLYVAADFTVNVTKAEGLSLPILESMAIGTPVIATNRTAMADHPIIPVEPNYTHIDVFGNTNRYYVFPERIAKEINKWFSLEDLNNNSKYQQYIRKGFKYIETRNNQNPVNSLLEVING